MRCCLCYPDFDDVGWRITLYYLDLMNKGRVCNCYPGPGCSKLTTSKLTTSLVNVSLKFQTLISQICQYFLLKKCEKLLQCKSFSHFFDKKYQCIWL